MNVKGVIHVGAHYGEEHPHYKNLGIKNICYFEPGKKTFNELKNRIGEDAKLFNFGLGSKNISLPFYYEDSDDYGCSSFLKPSSNYNSVNFTILENVEIKKLDDVEINSEDYNLLNIDVQGFELEVLKGSTKILEKIDYILTEVHRKTDEKILDYIGAPLIEEISEFLSKYNFELVETNWAGISWGDALYIKKLNN
jgi:FkbM family methyltransferase